MGQRLPSRGKTGADAVRETSHQTTPFSSHHFRAALILSVLVFASLGRLCMDEFVQWDDPQTIANNPAFNPPTILRIAAYWCKPAEALYTPLTYSVWGSLSYIAQVSQPDESGSTLNPWVFHFANVLIHLAATLFVFSILNRILRNNWAALFGATIFAVHPVQVEAVAWASGTKDLLCTLFIAASIDAFIDYRTSGEKRSSLAGRRWRWRSAFPSRRGSLRRSSRAGAGLCVVGDFAAAIAQAACRDLELLWCLR